MVFCDEKSFVRFAVDLSRCERDHVNVAMEEQEEIPTREATL